MACETDRDATEARFNAATACVRSSCLTRFLHANRYPLRLKTLCRSRPRLPGAVNAVFEAGQLLGADRAAGVEFTRRDSDLRAKTEFAAVGELRRRVVQHDRRIDLVEKFAGGARLLGHDRVGVVRAVIVNMRDR